MRRFSNLIAVIVCGGIGACESCNGEPVIDTSTATDCTDQGLSQSYTQYVGFVQYFAECRGAQ